MRSLLAPALALLLPTTPLAGDGPSSPVAPSRSLTVADGLAMNYVLSAVQDRDGFVWLGTGRGLNRYDGYDVRTYQADPEDAGTLSHDAIFDLHVDGQGVLWAVTEYALDRYDPATDSFTHYPHGEGAPGAHRPGLPSTIETDAGGRLWYATANQLNCLDPVSGEMRRHILERARGRLVPALLIDGSDRLWVATAAPAPDALGAGAPSDLIVYEGASRIETSLPEAQRPVPVEPAGSPVSDLGEDDQGHIWVARWGEGLTRWNPTSGELVRLHHDPDDPSTLSSDRVYRMAFDPQGGLWTLVAEADRITTLNRVEPASGTVARCPLPATVPCEGATLELLTLYFERLGALFIGTNGGGARVLDTLRRSVNVHRHRPGDRAGLSNDIVRAVYEGRDGLLWVGTTEGLDRLDRRSGVAQHFTPTDSHLVDSPSRYILAVHEGRDRTVWVGTRAGLYRFDRETETLVHPPHGTGEGDAEASLDRPVEVIHEDSQGRLWLGVVDRGLVVLNPDTGGIVRYRHEASDSTSLPSDRVTALLADEAGRLWVGTDSGLARYDAGTGTFVRYEHRPSDPASLSSNSVTALLERPEEPGILWVGTGDRGLNRLDVANGRARRYRERDSGLPDDAVTGILGDRSGRLWISASRGLALLDPETEEFRAFGLDRGLPSLEFLERATHQGRDGELFFGTVGGLVSFFPELLSDNPHPPRVLVTGLGALDRSGSPAGNPFTPLYRHGMPATRLELAPDQRDLAFDYVGLHYGHPEGTRYQHRLDGFEDDWRDAGTSRRAIYTNLDPGGYTFQVRAVSSDGVWSRSDAGLSFTIQPPFTATLWFRGLLALTVAGVLFGAYRWRVRRLRRQGEQLQRQVAERTAELRETLDVVSDQAGRLEKLDAAKSRLFANISHEFRTPLTLTLGPLEDVRSGLHGEIPTEALDEVDVAIRNTRRQLGLVEQLLTLARIEAGEMRLRARRVDISALLRQLGGAFDSLARRRDVAFEADLPDRALEIWADEEKLEQIVTNLLSNAFKFTASGGTVRLRLSTPADGASPGSQIVVIEVEDTGTGIPPDEIARVFDRFHQVDSGATGRPGVGIGLALVRELVELHQGEVSVESEPGIGSTFSIRLRRGQAHLRPEELATEDAPGPGGESRRQVDAAAIGLEEPATASDGERDEGAALSRRAKVLVIEDNAEMRRYLRKHLAASYQVVEAADGKSGVALAGLELPDLIVSDVMMPELDGLGVCEALRSDPELEFIPIILLTAKADLEAKLEGLDRGADDYLPKPFDARELLARIRNLIVARERLKEQARKDRAAAILRPGEVVPTSANESFLARVRGIVEAHLADESFAVVDLARETGLSRQHLHRRLQDLDAPSPSELIIQMRLQRAEQLLSRRAGDVAEVAYGVGFKSVSHFVRRFRERYGVTPAAFAARSRAPAK